MDDSQRRARALDDLGRHREARGEWAEAIAADPTDPDVWSGSARASLRIGDHLGAERAARRSIELAGAPTASQLITLSGAQLALGRPSAALASARAAVGAEPQNQWAWWWSARACSGVGALDEAAAAATRCAAGPDVALGETALGLVAEARGERERVWRFARRRHLRVASAHYRRALELTPDDQWTLTRLAWAEAGSGGRSSALRHARALAATGDPDAGDRLVAIADRCDAGDSVPAALLLVVVAVTVVAAVAGDGGARSTVLALAGGAGALAALVVLHLRRRVLVSALPPLAGGRVRRRFRHRSQLRAAVLAGACALAAWVTMPTPGATRVVTVPVPPSSATPPDRPAVPVVETERLSVTSGGSDFGVLPWAFGAAGAAGLVRAATLWRPARRRSPAP